MLEEITVWLGRHVTLPGSGRALSVVYPCDQRTRRYVRGVRRRSDGLLMELDSRGWIDWNLVFRGEFEPHITSLMHQLVPEGGVAVDVGANIGAHTLTLGKAVGPSGHVLAFEPNPITRSALERNVAMNGLLAITVHDCALGATSETLPLRVPRRDSREYTNMGLASLVALDTPHDLVNVQVRTLDQVVAQAGFARVDLVKIDVQGYECQVIEGMCELLATCAPAVIFEFEDWTWARTGQAISRLHEFFQSYDYRLWTIGKGHSPAVTELVDLRQLLSHAELLALKGDDPRAATLGRSD